MKKPMHWSHLLGILSIPFQSMIYLWISRHVGLDVYLDYGWIDTKIPFIRWFVLPYMSWMPILYLSFLYFFFVNRKVYWRTLAIYNTALFVCNLCFWFFATYVPRPVIETTDITSTLVNFIYQSDAPLNCFPSIHCLTSYLLFITVKRDLNLAAPLRILWIVLLWLIIASTVFIKQHSLLDVIGGIVLAEVTYRIIRYGAASFRRREKSITLNN
ncbi:phosphatase PAP2 family protein [Paenibacillus abyssi]|uniref:Phosphatidic acid phosphatase type 2/haloperoxidase domain-containing protein n=1 Tax=Paenibacillus abyssi TaxID=1340531 RepID=A0A917D162_9BACL|nr:phosphatase PAP2 family protein [Paenibacillus abyssi]GGG05834.1 hypothetical protein GCM10010916_23550 [Paenibacillus abyssi]